MSNSVYQTVARVGTVLSTIVRALPIGTNWDVACLLFTIMSGRLLWTRGGVVPALAEAGLTESEVRRAQASLVHGRWTTERLVSNWQQFVLAEDRFQAHEYEGIRPVACDLVGFFRPRLKGCTTKHYVSEAGKALPAVVFALVGSVGSVGPQTRQTRHLLPRLLLRQRPQEVSEQDLMRRAVREAGKGLASQNASQKAFKEALVTDAGFSLAMLLQEGVPWFVTRVDKNFTARRNTLPPYKGRGRRPEYGERIRPLARKRKGHFLPATEPDERVQWQEGTRTIRAEVFENLVLPTVRAAADASSSSCCFRCVVIHDPRYSEPLVLATNLSVSAEALWRLYRDRWPVEKAPLAAKQVLGAQRAYVFSSEGRWRLPELALLAGNILSFLAAGSEAVPTGFWDRAALPTCGRLRRTLQRVRFSQLSFADGRLRKKASRTDHLPKGILAHRRQSATTVSGT